MIFPFRHFSAALSVLGRRKYLLPRLTARKKRAPQPGLGFARRPYGLLSQKHFDTYGVKNISQQNNPYTVTNHGLPRLAKIARLAMTNSHSRHCEECSLRRSNPSSAENPKSSRLSHHQYQNAFGSAGRKACVRSPAQVKTQRAQALCVASLGNPSTSRPSTESASPKGFTLIEILIVIVIISIVSGIAALTITRNQQRDLQNLANSLTHLITLAEEEAILRPAILGLGFTPTQYQFFHYHHQVTEDHPQHWRAMTDKIFGSHPIPKNIYLRVVVQGKSVPLNGQPQIIISSSGDIVPLVILIGKTNARPTYQVIGNSNGEIKSELVHEK